MFFQRTLAFNGISITLWCSGIVFILGGQGGGGRAGSINKRMQTVQQYKKKIKKKKVVICRLILTR